MEKITLAPDFTIPLDIIYQDKDVIVINKQAGISVHPSINEPRGTLANALIARFPDLKEVGDLPRHSGEANLRPGIVHRLDKNTSGVMVIARNQEAFEFLKNQWKKGEVQKKYLALVHGELPQEKGIIELPLARSPKDFRKRIVVHKKIESRVKDARHAITEYKVRKKFADWTLVEVAPKTGRMHQIRVHFAALGHPVAGDTLYGPKKKDKEVPGLARQFLHAYFLSFRARDGKKLAFETDLPKDLSSALIPLENAAL